MRTTIATRLLVLVLALTVTAGLALTITMVPSLLIPPLEAWLRSLSPLQMTLLREFLFALPSFSAGIAVIAGSSRTARGRKSPQEPRWSPANRSDPFRTRSGHGA